MWRVAVLRGFRKYSAAGVLIGILSPLFVSSAPAVDAVFSRISFSQTNNAILFSSPTLADIDGNPKTLEIVVGDESGFIYGFDSRGNPLWLFTIRWFPGFEWVQTACQSSPAVADLDGDGAMEVIVTLASRDELNRAKPGAIFMFRLDATGRNPTINGGFARLTRDGNGDGIAEGAFPSPTVADLDRDGVMEIIAGTWDQLVYALRIDGSQFWHLDYDPTDPYEFGFKTGDTIWTTPAIADIDADGRDEVVLGTDAHNFPWGHQIPFQQSDGGLLVTLDGISGRLEYGPGRFFIESYHPEGAGWYYNPAGENHIPVDNISQVLQSSPVIADVDADGLFEIVHGTGQRFYRPTDDRHARVFCWNAENATQRWAAFVEDEVFASPAIANVDGDPELEIFARNFNDANPKLFGIEGASGYIMPGFPVPVRPGNPRSISAVIGDVDGDGAMEIITVSYGRLHVFSVNGREESGFYDIPNLMYTAPAIGDIDNDGICEMVLGGQDGLYLYRCVTGPAGTIPWGQYRRDARKSGVVPFFDSQPVRIEVLGEPVGGGEVEIRFVADNTGSALWTPDTVVLENVTPGVIEPAIPLPPGTVVANGERLSFQFRAEVPAQLGLNALQFQLCSTAGAPVGEPVNEPVVVNTLRTAARLWQHYR